MCIGENRMDEVQKKFFIGIKDAKNKLLSELEQYYNEDLFMEIINKLLVVTFFDREDAYMGLEDLEICKKILLLNYQLDAYDMKEIGYSGNFLTKKIKISKNTFLVYEIFNSYKTVPAFVRNILYFEECEVDEKCEMIQFELLGTIIVTTSQKVCTYVENAIYRKHQLERIKLSNFANSSSYMGSKKKLVGFVIEAMFPHCNENSIFLDIMCGSGSVSNALAQMGNVYASDAQLFCRLLAKIQGKGFEIKRAKKLIKEMYESYNYNLNLLQKEFEFELAEEEAIFHMDLRNKENVFNSYKSFVESFLLYSSTEENTPAICEKIERRKIDNSRVPYCLLTYYFSNVFFGLAQCIQLDSIRFAIDQIEDEEERQWALGVLVVVTSIIGTTYGGHFAQPKRIDIDSFETILTQRSRSAWLEFSKRMIAIATESERYPYKVKDIEGPWENALNYFQNMNKDQLIVYLDAPYKREEYSRYYHVLETIAKYDYPASENKGRMRSKNKGERFNTEFFTKTGDKIESVFERIITQILQKRAICAWSYSNNGAVSIMKVVTRIKEKCNCDVYYYSIPYKHLSQGKKAKSGLARIPVTEYCIVFVNKEK